MIYLLGNVWERDDYKIWLDKIQNMPAINKLQWDNVQNFFNLAISTEVLTKQVATTRNLKQFMEIVKEYDYSFTEHDLAWVMINQDIIWEFLATAEKDPNLRLKLLSTTTPQNFMEIAKQYNYVFSIEAFIWILVDIKSSSRVRITLDTGDAYTTPVIGRIPIGEWILLAEEWGMLAPFCHLEKPDTGLFKSGDIDDEKYFLYQCFLPHGYVNQRLVN